MKYTSTLYVDQKSNHVLHKKRLFPIGKRRLFQLPLLCIYLPEGGCRMEFTEIKNLDYPYFRHHVPTVVGFASGEQSAISILRSMIEETYQADPSLNYRKYLEEKGEPVSKFSEVKEFLEIEPKASDEEEPE